MLTQSERDLVLEAIARWPDEVSGSQLFFDTSVDILHRHRATPNRRGDDLRDHVGEDTKYG